jgi:Cft2 family RNA processing exonuclease
MRGAQQRRGRPQLAPRTAATLYTVQDARDTVQQMRREAYERPFAPMRRSTACFAMPGHILGSAIAEITVRDGRARRCWWPRAISGSPGGRSSATRRSSSRPTCC